jgi:hypothetical protein
MIYRTSELCRLATSGFVVAAIVLAAACAATAEGVTVSCRHYEVFSAGDTPLSVVYLLGRPVVPSSETVTVGGKTLVHGGDYWMDNSQGVVYLAAGAAAGSAVTVSYMVLPFTLKTSYDLGVVEAPAVGAAEPTKPPARTPERRSPYDLRASGSKTVSVEAGSLADFRVSQALDLSIGGKVGEGVEVRGVLSDKDMSLAENTSTTKLKDLDRVFMEVRSPNASARVGDLEIDEAPGELLSFKRSLTGFLGNASMGSGRLELSGAQSRSRYETVQIEGREGIAGPYRILSSAGEGVTLTAGSDKVWLDGEPMKRGKLEDYTIDYQAGEISFNPKRLIRDGARIAVDYETETVGDRRQLYFARTNLGVGKRGGVAVSFLSEGADPSVADAASDPLAAAGAPTETAADGWIDGAKFVGLGAGAYVRATKDSRVYYEYAGEGGGDYDVTFTLVGDGQGSYSYIFSDRWEREIHVYTGVGAYVDRIRAPSRLTTQILHVSAVARPVDGLEVTTELAQSRGHKQTDGAWNLSEDRAYVIGLKGTTALPGVANHATGALDLAARRRWVGPNYLAVGRLRGPDFLERWAQDPGDGFEATDEVGLTYRLAKLVTACAELGSMSAQGGDSRRRKFAVDLGTARLGASASSEKAGLETDSTSRGMDRTAIGVRVPVKFVGLELGRTSEVRSRLVDSTSLARVEYYSAARVGGKGGAVSVTVSEGSEDRDQGSGWRPYSSSLDSRLEFETDRGRRLALRGQVAHRVLAFSPPVGLGEHRMTSADLGLNIRDIRAISLLALDYQLANTLTSAYTTELVRVGPGSDYDSLGNFTPGTGAFEIARHETGKQPVTRMAANLALETGLKGKIMLQKTLASRTTLEVEGESDRASLGDLALPNPWFVVGGDGMLFGRANLAEELVINRMRGVTVSIIAKSGRTLDARCADRTERVRASQLQARVATSSLKNTSAGVDWRIGSTRRIITTGQGEIQPSGRTWSGGLDLERAVSTALRTRVDVEISSEDRAQPDSKLTEGTLSPGFTFFLGALRWDGGMSIRRILKSNAASTLVALPGDALDWNSRLNLRRGRYTSFALEYVGRKARATPTIHNVKASLSAAF